MSIEISPKAPKVVQEPLMGIGAASHQFRVVPLPEMAADLTNLMPNLTNVNLGLTRSNAGQLQLSMNSE